MKKLQMWYISRRKRTILQFIRRRSFVRSFNFHLPLPPRQIRILIIRCIATLAITHTEFRGHTAPLHYAPAACHFVQLGTRNFVLGFSLCEHRKQEQKPEDEVLHNAFADRLIVANREYSSLEISARKKFRRLIYRSFFLVSRYESRIFKTNERVVWLRILWGDELQEMPFNRINLNSIDTRRESRGRTTVNQDGGRSIRQGTIGNTAIDNIREIIEIELIRRRYD